MGRRLLIGILKGLSLGGALGALLHGVLGWVFGSVFFSYLVAIGVGAFVGALGGRLPWKVESWVEASLRIAAGAGLGAGLCWASATFLSVPVPIEMTGVPEGTPWVQVTLWSTLAFGVFIGVLLELENDGVEDKQSAPGSSEAI